MSLCAERRLHWISLEKSTCLLMVKMGGQVNPGIITCLLVSFAGRKSPQLPNGHVLGNLDWGSYFKIRISGKSWHHGASCKLVLISYGSHPHEELYAQEVRSELCWTLPLERSSLNP